MNRPDPERLDLSLANGCNLHAAQGGSGADVVLVHGAVTVLEDMLLGPYDALAERFRVTAFDRPGHGRSGRRRLDASIWGQAAALQEGAERLGLKRPVVIGHSFGGSVALAWALRHPEAISGLVLLAPVSFPELRLEQILFGPRAIPLAGDVLARTGGRAFDALAAPALARAMFSPQPIPERMRNEFPLQLVTEPRHMQAEGEDAVQAVAGLAAAAMLYPSCRLPVRILAGSSDRVVNPSLHGRALAALLPRGGFSSLEGLGHMLHHFAQAEIVEAVEAVRAAADR